MSQLTVSLGQQMARAFGQGVIAWERMIRDLVKALERGDSCLTLSKADARVAASQAVVAEDGSQPFVLEGCKLYLQRYWQHETTLARRLTNMAASTTSHDRNLLPYFTDEHQRAAAELALTRQLAVITGGPGTGKTTTVVKILALLLMQNPALEIVLAAPTGKAAMRLTESIGNGKRDETHVRRLFAEHIEALDAVPGAGKTLHRLLGVQPQSPEFRHNVNNPLSADVVVVDEASMIDLGMMSRLVQALKPSAKLILMGDKDQLASVEAGAVLADISQGLPANRVHLQNTYRFGGDIKTLAQAVNEQRADEALTVLADSAGVVEWSQQSPLSFAKAGYAHYWQTVAADPTAAAEIFQAFAAFQVLCATRADKSRFDGLADSTITYGKPWYVGRPVMILENHAELGLYNGDIGIALPGPTQQLMVYFPIEGSYKGFLPARLPIHETAYAMTIHKSQGSEFEHVFIVLPERRTTEEPEAGNELLSKELLYTAITRAKQRVTIRSDIRVLQSTIGRRSQRQSGLAGRL